jgi:hypothetical protein
VVDHDRFPFVVGCACDWSLHRLPYGPLMVGWKIADDALMAVFSVGEGAAGGRQAAGGGGSFGQVLVLTGSV